MIKDEYNRDLMARDLHQALKTEIVKQASGGGCNFTLVRMQWSKTEVANGLHANPNTFGSAGFQRSDFLKLLGLERRRCSFIATGECYSQFVPDNFDFDAFIKLFEQAYNQLLEAEHDLNACGYSLPQPEGGDISLAGHQAGRIAVHLLPEMDTQLER